MKATTLTRQRQHRVIFALIAMLLFARSAVAFHDSIHANVLDDHCQVAQLGKNTTSTLPVNVIDLLPFFTETARSELTPQQIHIIGIRQFLIRAPPSIV